MRYLSGNAVHLLTFMLAPFHRHLITTLILVICGVSFVRAETKYVEGDVIVTFKRTANLDKANGVLKKKSMSFRQHFDGLSAKRQKHTGLVRNANKTTAQLIADLKDDPDVESVEPNYLRWVKTTPDDARFAEQWALQNSGQTVNGATSTAGADVQYLKARASQRTNTTDQVVGVIDTGIDYTHPDLAPNIWTNTTEIPGNGIDDDGDGYIDDVHGYDFASSDADPYDSGYHGTHVAGTIAAVTGNGAGVAGINDHIKVIALKVSGDGTTISTSSVILALQYATMLKNKGVNIVALNASYGGGGFSTAESAAISDAGAAGIVLCVAAGNESANNDINNTYPAAYRLSNMIVVAATGQNDELASYSNYGATTVDLAAPGTNILSTQPSTVSFTAGGTTYTSTELTYSGRTTGVTGTLVYCGLGNTNEFPASVSGNIALIQRGTLTFATKVANAKAAGATAAIIYNNVAGNFSGTLQNAGDWIPARSISLADGTTIKATLPVTVTGSINVTGNYQFLEGTSMAAPHVTSAVAFAASNFPNDSMSRRRQRVMNAVDEKSSLSGKVATSGRLNLMHIIDGGVDGAVLWPVLSNASKLPTGVVGEPYTTTLSSTGGTAPYTYSLTGGSLPNGFTLSESGVLRGTATNAGATTFTITPSDTNGPGELKIFSITIAAEPLIITTDTTLPSVSAGTPYDLALTASGGTAPYSWSLQSGELPSGIEINDAGVISGLPDSAESTSFTLVVNDHDGLSTSRSFTLAITGSPVSITSLPILATAVKGVAYAQALSATGGSAPYTWTLSSGALPAGLVISSSGSITGAPSVAGSFSFTVHTEDSSGFGFSQRMSLIVYATYQIPVIKTLSLPTATMGDAFSYTVSAINYPKTFAVSGLPKGLTYSSSTGAISGRPSVSGSFQVKIKATNTAGTSPQVPVTLTVSPLASTIVGSFAGIVARDATANGGLGARLSLTTTSLGYYTVKLTKGITTSSAVGYMTASTPQIHTTVGGVALSLTLDATTQLLSGSHGTAPVSGWRSTWNATTKPATTRTGYYTVSLDLANTTDQGVLSIPQGSGYATFTVASSGTLTVAGKVADGQAISSSSFAGPNGEVVIYTSLYGNLGSIAGKLTLAGESTPANRIATGDLTWLKPTNTSRTYASTLGPLHLSAYGQYLAPAASGSIALGLPTAGTASLNFTDGGLHLATIDPDLPAFTYNSNYTVTPPTAGSMDNPGKVTLAINKSSGAVSGTFTLLDGTLTRKVSYQGYIVRPASGNVKARGYFLLPQIPVSGQTSSTTPILSGGVQIAQ